MTAATLKTDIALVGAGIVGLAAALGLQQAGFSVVLIDSKHPLKGAVDLGAEDWDSRIYAISPKNVEWLKSLGVWQLLNPARIGEMQAMEIWGDATTSPLTLFAEDANSDYLGLIVEAKALTQALMQRIEATDIQILFDSPCEVLTVSSNTATVRLLNGKLIESALLLAADGSHSWVREKLNMPSQNKNYDQVAIVANFEIEKSHSHIARQWFAQDTEGNNAILAWLPLPGNRISIVWSVSTSYAEKLLLLSEDKLSEQVKLAGGDLLGELKLIGLPKSFPLSLQTSNTLVQDCVVLIGDAAHLVHPMAGQGMNLGFRDVIDLLKIIKEKNAYQAVNDPSLLKRYARIRKADILNMLLLTDGLYQLYGSHNSLVRKIRNWGFSATKYKVIKKLLVANAIAL